MSFKPEYVIADHIRAACFVMADGVKPSGKQRGYVLRRLIRRSLASSLKMNIDISNKQYFVELVDATIGIYDDAYPELKENRENAIELLFLESEKYSKALIRGEKEWQKILNKNDKSKLTPDFLAEIAWDLYQTHGVPIEASEDILGENDLEINKEKLDKLIETHQNLSQDSSKGQFKSGLADHTEKTIRLHTVTHILHSVLRDMFGEEVKQTGSAITDEKARFDFTMDRKLDENEVEELTSKIQEIIDKNLEVNFAEMSEGEARELGATGLFNEKYGDIVTVYTIQNGVGEVFSREFCGGPHVENTSKIGKFKVLRQKSVGQGVKRIEYDVE